MAVYGHVTSSCFVMEVKGQQSSIQVRLACPYFDWEALKKSPCQYAVIEVEDGGIGKYSIPKKLYDYEAELEWPSQGASFYRNV